MKRNSQPIIADSSALFSLLIQKDSNHDLAIQASEKILNDISPIIIPSDVFSEVTNLLGKKIDHQTAVEAGQLFLASSGYSVVEASYNNREAALNKFSSQPQSVSFTDCIVMAFADEFETKQIFGFDETFKKNGYQRLGLD